MPNTPPCCELVWPGKEAALAALGALRPSDATLRVIERHGDDDAATDGWRNALIQGDNLAVLSRLLPDLAGRVQVIYIDPPFSTGDHFSLTTPIGDATSGSAVDLPAFGDRWSPGKPAFLSMLLPRLSLMRELLSETGVLFAHLDDNVGHEVKLLLDEVFGARHFRGEIVWRLGNGAKSRRFFSVQHNTVYAYSKTDAFLFDPRAPILREPYADGSLKTHFRSVDGEGRRYRRRVINGKEYVYYADEGRMVGSVWTDIPSMAANSPVVAESTGYPTQKPERLLERLIAACSRENDIVADLFCGSGTTLAVAGSLGRRWIGCDESVLAVHTTRKRLVDRRTRPGGSAPFDLLVLDRAAPAATEEPVDGAARIAASVRSARSPEQGPTHAIIVTLEGLRAIPEDVVPAAVRSLLSNWSDLVDYWAVDWDFDGAAFVSRWQAYRTRKSRLLALTTPPHAYPTPAPRTLGVQVVDIFGRSSVKAIEWRPELRSTEDVSPSRARTGGAARASPGRGRAG